MTVHARRPALAAAVAAALLAAVVAGGARPVPAATPLSPPVAGDRKADLPAIVRSLAVQMKQKNLGKREPEDIAKRLAGIGEDDLSWILDRLHEVPAKERGEAAPEVEKVVQDILLTARYTAGILRIPDAAKRVADPSMEVRCQLLAELTRLEDPEPATRFAIAAYAGGMDPVRLRVVDSLGDLASWGGDASRVLPALQKCLADPSPAVRDLALERLANLSDPVALDWALEHMGEAPEETVLVREKKERRCPGERAMEIVTRVSKLHWGMAAEAFRDLAEEDRKALRQEYKEWREKAGASALRNGDEGSFDPIPRVSSAIVEPSKDATATLRWWSVVDRAQFRMDLDDMEVTPSTRLDFSFGFHLSVIASGARQGSWDTLARRIRCGSRHRLPRRGFGLVETSIQPLLDGRWKVWVYSFEFRGG